MDQRKVTIDKAVAASRSSRLITLDEVRNDPFVATLVHRADEYLGAVGYTHHGESHVNQVAENAHRILHELEFPERQAQLAAIAGYLHDVGNVIHRNWHAQAGALLSYDVLSRLGMPIEEMSVIMGAVGNHDESDGDPISNVCAALIIADKSDVRRSRVRNPKMINFDIHDRVNYAAEESQLFIDKPRHLITLKLKIDTEISQVMEYFEIFTSRMNITRRSATYLNCDFALVMNDVKLL
jgi:metal-dependent HD superfamily phosphatase/phosphodiesterase